MIETVVLVGAVVVEVALASRGDSELQLEGNTSMELTRESRTVRSVTLISRVEPYEEG